MAAVIAGGGLLAGMTVAELISMIASGASAVSAMSTIAKNVHELGLAPHDPVPAEHLPALTEAIGQLTVRPRYAVCGVDCHAGDAVCNNFCGLAPQLGRLASRRPVLQQIGP